MPSDHLSQQQDLIAVSADSVDPADVVAAVSAPDAGAVVLFVGTVRDNSRGHSIRHLEYEAYPEMAEREIRKITDKPVVKVIVSHYHADHILGLEVFKDEGAEIIAPAEASVYLDTGDLFDMLGQATRQGAEPDPHLDDVIVPGKAGFGDDFERG